MTVPMTMNGVIHSAVRRDLDRLATALAELPPGDTRRAAELARAFGYLRAELTRHHEGEDTHIWPWLGTQGVDPELLTAMRTEHAAMSAALADIHAALGILVQTGSAADLQAARDAVHRGRAVVDDHLAHEETDLEPLVRPLMATPGWTAVEKRLRKAPIGVAGSFFAWLTDGMADAERQHLRSTVPPPVVAVLSRVFGGHYRRDVAPVWSRPAR